MQSMHGSSHSAQQLSANFAMDKQEFKVAKEYFDQHKAAIKFSRYDSGNSSYMRDPDTDTTWKIVATTQFPSHKGGFGRVKMCVNESNQPFVIKIQQFDLTNPKERLRIEKEASVSVDQGFAQSKLFLRTPVKKIMQYVDATWTSTCLGANADVLEDYLFIRREVNTCDDKTVIKERLEKEVNNLLLNKNIAAVYICLQILNADGTYNEKLLCFSRDRKTVEIEAWNLYSQQLDLRRDANEQVAADHILSDAELRLFHQYRLLPYMGKAYQIYTLYDRTLDEHVQKMQQQPRYNPRHYKNHCLDVAIQLLIQVYQLHKGLSSKTGKTIAHRDIKPSNVMFDKTGSVRLIDFGLSSETPLEPVGTAFVGTAIYCPFDDDAWKDWTHAEIDFLAALRSIFYPSGITHPGWVYKSSRAWIDVSRTNNLIDNVMLAMFPSFIQELLDTERLIRADFQKQKISPLFVAAALIMYQNNVFCTNEDIESLKDSPSQQAMLVKQYKEQSDDAVKKIENIAKLLCSYQQKLQIELQEIICLKNNAKNPEKYKNDIASINKKLSIIQNMKTMIDNPYKTVFDKCRQLQAALADQNTQSLTKHRYGFFGQTAGAKVIEKMHKLLTQQENSLTI